MIYPKSNNILNGKIRDEILKTMIKKALNGDEKAARVILEEWHRENPSGFEYEMLSEARKILDNIDSAF